jgi:TRAP-type C4-dicarboxylate transport system permease small subunit
MADGVLGRIDRIVGAVAQSASNIFLILILVGVFTEVVSRYLLHQSHGFMEEFCKWSQIWIAYLMLGLVERSRGHIKVDILLNRISDRAKKPLLIIFDLICLVFAAALFFSGLASTQNLYVLGSKSTSGVPVPLWVPTLAAMVGALLLAFVSLNRLVEELRSGTAEG